MDKVNFFLMFASIMLLECNNTGEKRSPELMTMRDSVRNDSVRNDSVRNDSARNDSARNDSARNDSARNDSARNNILVDDEFALQSVHRMEDNDSYPYRIELIHERLDSFLKGKIIDDNLEPYRDMVESKFYILDVHCVMAGTMYFKIIFPKHPHAEFVAATGIDVDDNDSITAYHLFEIKRKGK